MNRWRVKERKQFVLTKVLSHHPYYEDRVIFSEGESRFENCLPPLKSHELDDVPISYSGNTSCNRLYINYLTPTRLKHAGTLTGNPEFYILVRSLLRRISSLYYFYQGKTPHIDHKYLIEAALSVKTISKIEWQSWERYSNWQQARISMGGFTGIVCYEGDLGQFLPLIRLGLYTHVGKGAVFGQGKYEMNNSLLGRGNLI